MKIKNQNFVIAPFLFLLLLLISSSALYAQEPTGACCIPGTNVAEPTCRYILEADCNQLGGTWLGENGNCEECYDDVGKCCLSSECQNLSWEDCTQQEGFWLGEYSVCDDCDLVTGACCFTGTYSPSCYSLTEDGCIQIGGVWLGENVDCEECFDGPGACCLGWDIALSCTYNLTWDDCTMFEGIWLGEYGDCDDCDDADLGVCCLSDDPYGCSMTTAETCAQWYGWNLFLGLDTDCRENSCTPNCGDLDFSQAINILDVIFLLDYKYKCATPPFMLESADVDGSGVINILDAVYLVNYKYKGGPDPICPGLQPERGPYQLIITRDCK